MFRQWFHSLSCDPATASTIYPIFSSCEQSYYNGGAMEQIFCTTNATLDLGDVFYLDFT